MAGIRNPIIIQPVEGMSIFKNPMSNEFFFITTIKDKPLIIKTFPKKSYNSLSLLFQTVYRHEQKIKQTKKKYRHSCRNIAHITYPSY